MTITTSDGFWNRAWNNTEQIYWAVASRTPVIKTMYSCWLTMCGATGAIPTSWAACTKATTGALPYTNAGSGLEKRLLGMSIAGNTSKKFDLWDRLGACGGIDANSASVQSINSTEVTRGVVATGANLCWCVEVNAAPGSTSRVLTVNGTDYDGMSRTPTVTVPASAAVTSLIRIPTSGYFLRTIESVQFAGGVMGSSGNLGLVAARCLHMPDTAVNAAVSGPAETGLVKIEADSCLWLTENTVMGTAGDAHGLIYLIEG